MLPFNTTHHRLLDTDVKRDALELAKAGLWDDAGPEQAIAQGGAGGGTLANSQVSTKNYKNSLCILQF